MDRQRALSIILWLAVTAACAACGPSSPRATAATPTVSPQPPTFWRTAAQPYAGVVLRGLSEDSPPSNYVRDVLAPRFEAETGIRIDLNFVENPEVEQAIARRGSEYDFIYVEQDMIYSYLNSGYLTDLSTMFAAEPALVSPDFDVTDFIDFVDEFRDPSDGALYGIPIEAFIKTYVYRQDLFEDPDIRQAFQAQYNYPLAPAVTFGQYRDIAAFFTRYASEQGLDLWGSSFQGAADTPAFYEFFETIAPSFGIYNWGINLETNAATTVNGGALDSERTKEALAFWLEMLTYAPPEAVDSSWHDVADAFGEGRIAQGWLYGEYIAALGSDPTRSKVAGKLGVALPPTAPGVIEDAIVGAGYLGYYDGAAFGIPIESRQKEAALLWLQYLGQPAVQPEWAANTSRIVHLSTFNNLLVKAQDRKLNQYYTLMKEQGHLFAGAPPTPYHAEIRDAIAPYIRQAILGGLTPDEALDQAAQAVDIRLKELVGDD